MVPSNLRILSLNYRIIYKVFNSTLTSTLRPCVPLTQLVELDFRELLDLNLTKVVISYITRELYITSFIKNNKFLAIITSFLTKIASFLTKIASFLTKMTFKTRYITAKLVI
jgi:hypothetical protein